LHPIDFAVVVLVMLAVTYVGHRLSGNIKDRKGFFQADGSMPWWAVSASIIATVVSSVTFISVPAAVFAEGGNFMKARAWPLVMSTLLGA
jgi:Na+/proline symporter